MIQINNETYAIKNKWHLVTVNNSWRKQPVRWCSNYESKGQFCAEMPWVDYYFEYEADAIWFKLQGF